MIPRQRVQIDWGQAHDGATHAVTTSPGWDGSDELRGVIEFATLDEGRYYDPAGSWFSIGERDWIVLAERSAEDSERERAIHQITEILVGCFVVHRECPAAAAALYDAGYRKVEGGAQ